MYCTTPGTPPERILPTVGLNVGRMQVLTCYILRMMSSTRSEHRAQYSNLRVQACSPHVFRCTSLVTSARSRPGS